jgi:hypothetical protein
MQLRRSWHPAACRTQPTSAPTPARHVCVGFRGCLGCSRTAVFLAAASVGWSCVELCSRADMGGHWAVLEWTLGGAKRAAVGKRSRTVMTISTVMLGMRHQRSASEAHEHTGDTCNCARGQRRACVGGSAGPRCGRMGSVAAGMAYAGLPGGVHYELAHFQATGWHCGKLYAAAPGYEPGHQRAGCGQDVGRMCLRVLLILCTEGPGSSPLGVQCR